MIDGEGYTATMFHPHLPSLLERFTRDTGIHAGGNVVMIGRSGSRAYNTFTDSSDHDYTGLIVPNEIRLLGLEPFEHWTPKFGTLGDDMDLKMYSISKGMQLLLKGNPNSLELLWLPSFCYEFMSPWGRLLIDRRDIFSSKRVYQSLVGYAKAQFYRMTRFDDDAKREWEESVAIIEAAGWTKEMVLNGHHRPMPDLKAVDDVAAPPGAGPYNEVVAKNTLDDATHRLKRLHVRHFAGYMGEQRKELVKKHGYDPKNASHLVRLLILGEQFVKTRELNIWMVGPERERVMQIKRGEWHLDDVQKYATELFESAEAAAQASDLPDEPNRVEAEKLLIEIQLSSLRKGGFSGGLS